MGIVGMGWENVSKNNENINILNIYVILCNLVFSTFPLYLQRRDLHTRYYFALHLLTILNTFKYYEENTSYKNKTSPVNRDV